MKFVVKWVICLLVLLGGAALLVEYQHETGVPQQWLNMLAAYWNAGNPAPLPNPVAVPTVAPAVQEPPETVRADAVGHEEAAPSVEAGPRESAAPLEPAARPEPSASFAAILKAQEQYDLATFRSYVDLDEVAHVFGASIKANAAALKNVAYLGIGKLSELENGAAVARRITEAIETGAATGQWLLFPPMPDIQEETRWSLDKVRVENAVGKVCYASVPLEFPKLERAAWLRYRLRDVGTHWQIASLDCDGFYAAVKEIGGESVKRHNVAIDESNKEMANRIAQAVKIRGVTRKNIYRYFGRNSMEFTFQSENIGKEALAQYGGTLVCKSKDGKEVARIPFNITAAIAPGATSSNIYELKAGLLSGIANIRVYNMRDDEIQFEPRVLSVKLANGEALQYRERLPGTK